MAKQVLPLFEERVKIGFPLTSITLRRALLHAHLLARKGSRASHMVWPDALPHPDDRASYEATAIQAEYVAQTAKEKAERIEQQTGEVMRKMLKVTTLSPAVKIHKAVEYIGKQADESVREALKEAILAADRAAEARVNLLLLDQPHQKPMYLGAKSNDAEAPPVEESLLIPRGGIQRKSYGSVEGLNPNVFFK